MRLIYIFSPLLAFHLAPLKAQESHEENPKTGAIRAIPINRQERETLGPALCLNEIETNLWNIFASKWAEESRRTQNKDLSESLIKNDLTQLLAPTVTAAEAKLNDQKKIIQGLSALEDSIQAFGKDFDRQIKRDFGTLLNEPDKRCQPGKDGGLSPICLVYQAFAQNHDPKYLKAILNSYGKFHSNFSEDGHTQFSDHFPLEDAQLGNPKSLEKLNFFLGTKYSVYAGFIQQWQERLNNMSDTPAHKMSPRAFERELGEAIGRSKTLSAQSLSQISSYKDASKKWDYIQAETQRLMTLAQDAATLGQSAESLSKTMEDKRKALNTAIEEHDTKVKNDKAKILELSREINQFLHDGGTYKVGDKIKQLSLKLGGFLKGKIPDDCSGRATASTLTDGAKFYQKHSNVDPNQFVIDLIEHAKDLDKSCEYVKTGNTGNNKGKPFYRKLFVASFLRNVCQSNAENDVRFKGPLGPKNDALSHDIFRSDNAWAKWLPRMQSEIINGDKRYSIHPEHQTAAQSAHFGTYIPKNLVDSYALMYSLGQRETGNPEEALPNFEPKDPDTKEIGFFHTSTNTKEFFSDSTMDIVKTKALEYYRQIKVAETDSDFNEICRMDAFPGKYNTRTNKSSLKGMAARCTEQKYLSNNFHACVGTLVNYCPTATLDYESFVVREARRNHGPLLLPGEPLYNPKRPNPVPACSAMFTLLAANSKFLCQNLETTSNYQVKDD